MRQLSGLIALSVGATVAVACARQPRPRASSRRLDAAQGPLDDLATPAGRWMHDTLDSSGCVDCPTPRFALVLARGELASVVRRMNGLTQAPPGYPMVMLPAELGWEPRGDEVVVIAAMFASRTQAEAWQQRTGTAGRVRALNLAAADRRRTVVRLRRPAAGRSRALVERTDGTPGTAPASCMLEEGLAFLVETDDVLRIPDARPWVRLPCRGGDGTNEAMFPVADTDLGLVVRRRGDRIVEIQDAGGICGARHFDERVVGDHATAADSHTLASARCFDQPAGDAWQVCPDHSLQGCVGRAEALLTDASDLRRAARVAAYACAWGAPAACAIRWRVDLARGVDRSEVLARAVTHCRFEAQGGGDAPDTLCPVVDDLLRETPVASLRPHGQEGRLGDLFREGCLRELAGWCELLEQNPLCDTGGCG